MAKFTYTFTDDSGVRQEGKIDAPSQSIAIQKLRADGVIILSINEDHKGSQWIIGRPKMSTQEKMMFVKNLATMIKVGITITEGLSIIRDQAERKSIKKMFDDIIDMINSGQSLAKSLKKYDNNFSPIFINMIETGEEAGNLEKVLSYLDLQLEKEYELRKKVVGAMIYPAIIVSITVLMAIGIVVFIMPKITKIFRSFKMELPLPTKIMIGLSDLLIQKPFTSLFAVVAVVALFIFLFKLKALKPFWHRIILSLPIFGKILVSANVARFARTLNSLIQATVPVTDALVITANMLDNYLYRRALTEASEKVEQGGKIGESLELYPKLFPILFTKLIFLGEKTGTLETITEKAAELYERETDTKTKNLSVVIEPLLLVFMAGIVGGMAISVMLPIYQLPNLLSR
ncbi:MAG: type II secretion system F family protein [Candidatus Gracilibacteria bacterium]|jgi:type IV pilus assembly protein PilC